MKPESITPPENARRMKLVRIAAHLFRQHGYERTTVRDLAQAAGLQSGSLFYHFRSKDEILAAVMALGITSTTERLQQRLAIATNTRERLAALVHIHLHSLLGENQYALEVMLYEWNSVSESARPPLIALRDTYENLWQQVLDEAAAAGLVHPDTRLLRRVLLGSLHWTVQWYRPEGELTVDQLAEQILALHLIPQ